MDIKILSRMEAAANDHLLEDPTVAFISIYCSNDKPLFDLHPRVLSLQYDDVEHDYGNRYKLFHDGHAEQVLDFVDRVKDQTELFVIHCYAGVSRSSATAVKVAQYLDRDDLAEELFDRYPYINPNRRVARILQEAMTERKNEARVNRVDNRNSK